MKYIGPHVSASGGVENAPLNAKAIGATAFALFTKNQRQWVSAPLTQKSIDAFKKNCIAITKISEKEIDRAVRNILKLKFELGLFENPYIDETASAKVDYAPEHLEVNVAEEDEERVIEGLYNYGSLFIGGNTAERGVVAIA